MENVKINKGLAVILLCSLLLVPGWWTEPAQAASKRITLAVTGGIHSRLEGEKGIGGMAKLATAIQKSRQKQEDLILLDAGNFSMGSPFQTIYSSHAGELRMLGALGYDAVGLGGSEFSYGRDGLRGMLKRASKEEKIKETTSETWNEETYQMDRKTTVTRTMPEVVCAGLDWVAMRGEDKKGTNGLSRAWTGYGVSDYTIVQQDRTSIAVFGLMSTEEQEKAAEQGFRWKDRIQRAQEIVDEIQKNEKVDMIVCLSTADAAATDEDGELARQASGIDVIVQCTAGYDDAGEGNHVAQRDEASGTIFVAAGSDRLTRVNLQGKAGSYQVAGEKEIPLDDTISGDPVVQAQVDEFKSVVDGNYLSRYGYTYDESLTTIRKKNANTENAVVDAMAWQGEKAEDGENPIDVAIVSSGSIAGSLSKGAMTVADAYDICGLGEGADGTPAYPLATCYLSGKDLKRLAEITAIYAEETDDADLHFSGLTYSVNRHRSPLNKAFEIRLIREDGSQVKIDDKKLYHIVTGWHEIQQAERTEGLRLGLLHVTPLDAEGNAITDLKKTVLHDGKREIKEWQALAGYLKKKGWSGENDEARIQDKTGINPVNLIKEPSRLGIAFWAGILLILVIIAGIFLLLRQRRNARRGFSRRAFGAKKRRSGKPVFKPAVRRRRSRFRR